MIYNGMIAPLAGFTIGGVVWNQGESNANYCTRSQYVKHNVA